MNSDTAGSLRVVLDTNILFSAIGFGGKPARIVLLVTKEEIEAITSPILIAELEEALTKKLALGEEYIELALEDIRDNFTIVHPGEEINVLKDTDDNRVLEAAVEGKCEYIITGDKELLTLKIYKGIKILTADEFLDILST